MPSKKWYKYHVEKNRSQKNDFGFFVVHPAGENIVAPAKGQALHVYKLLLVENHIIYILGSVLNCSSKSASVGI
jgi:predicted naringenin-chalcone synthase